MSSLSKLRWRCRRGMRELDVVLLRFLDESYASLDEEDKVGFQQLLECQDPDILAYLTGRSIPSDGAIRNVIEGIRSSLGGQAT
ncbi:MAG: succinate dehydrogenase assembly factor 2 [Chromatiales bacterium]|nr:succinate dehydrogenase assembly factor 2 [Chromatiales bacterium]MDH4030556.1 succinate dehydrogenase assembly factor 2 [Chromatiales bacterium]